MCSTPAGREEEYTLFVNDVPAELDENGLKKLFNSYGVVSSIISPRGSNYAFVTYQTYAEAELAISSLNNQAPLYIRVEFRKKRPVEEASTETVPGECTVKDFRYADSTYSSFSTGNAAKFRLTPTTNGLSAMKYTPDPQGYIPQNVAIYNPYDDVLYPDTNALWSRGCMTVDAAGRRHVALGRPHTLYHIPEPYPAAEDHITSVITRNPTNYRRGVDVLVSEVGSCERCQKDALLCCSQCDCFYCSRDCQLEDWPKHQKECLKAPSLVMSSTKTAMNAHKSNTTTARNAHQVEEAPVTIRRPYSAQSHRSDTQQSASNVPEVQGKAKGPAKIDGHEQQSITLPKPPVSLSARLQNCRVSGKLTDEADFKFTKELWLPKDKFTEVQVVVVCGSGVYYVQKTAELGELQSLMTNLHSEGHKLPPASPLIIGKMYAALYDGIWHRAMILGMNPTKLDYVDYGTVEDVNFDDFRELGTFSDHSRFARMVRLSGEAKEKFKTLAEESIMYVRMINIDPKGVIDVEIRGDNPNASPVDQEKAPAVAGAEIKHPIASPMQAAPKPHVQPAAPSMPAAPKPSVQPVASPMQAATKQHVQPAAPSMPAAPKPSVQPVASPMQAATKPCAQPVAASMPAAPKQVNNGLPKVDYVLGSILDTFVAGTTGVIADIVEMIDEHSASLFLASVDAQADFELLLEPLQTECQALAKEFKYFIPQVDDLVCVLKTNGDWLRGRVVSIQPAMKIASLDEGAMLSQEEVTSIIPLPERFKAINVYSGIMESKNTFPVKIASNVELSIIKREVINGEIIIKAIIVSEGYNNVPVELKPWQITKKTLPVEKPKPMLVGVTIPNKARVVIQSYRSPSVVYLRPVDDIEVEKYNRLMQDIAKAAQTAPPLVSLPSQGDVVLAQYVDNNYYRALVLALDEQKIKIAYIDFGNNEITELGKLRKIPESLVERSRASAQAVLKGIQEVPPTKEAIEHLAMISADEMPFICTYEEGLYKDGVTLTTAKGESLNDMINELLTPSFKKESEKPVGHLEMTDMDMALLGTVGETVDAYFLDTIAPGSRYVFAPIDSEMIQHISTVLPESLMSYCEKSALYIPRNNELCIAKFDEGWYRACCINHSFGPDSAEIYFVDFGNTATVAHRDIRKMPRDFLKPPALGCICILQGEIPAKIRSSPTVLDKLTTKLISNDPYKVKIVKKEEAQWTIELPGIEKQLRDEGVL